MFGTPLYFLQINQIGEATSIADTFGTFWPVNVLYNQYMLMIGEFSMDAFTEPGIGTLCTLIILISLFITQITFLNMLVGIMGNSLGEVTEKSQHYSLETRL